MMYFVVLAIFSREIDDVQFVLGCLVAVREGIYLVSSVACLWLCPAYLLVDVWCCRAGAAAWTLYMTIGLQSSEIGRTSRSRYCWA